MNPQSKRTPSKPRAARRNTDELGAHVSTAGGLEHAPARAASLSSCVLQLFTKQPSRWAERLLDAGATGAFLDAAAAHGIRSLACHDSYLINLASPDPTLFHRSRQSFVSELERCRHLGIHHVVTHPGNAMGARRPDALARNADAIEYALEESHYTGTILLETTAGAGTALGSTFEELASLIARISTRHRDRIGVCFDTCHIWAAGYDLRDDYDGVLARFDDVVGIDRIRLFHLNDSLFGVGTHRDRHADIGKGALGDRPFRRLVTDPRFTDVPKVLETPKGKDPTAADRRNLRRLRRYRREG